MKKTNQVTHMSQRERAPDIGMDDGNSEKLLKRHEEQAEKFPGEAAKMSEPSKVNEARKITPIKAHGIDALARLERLEDLFLAALQDIRAIKTELKSQADVTPGLEKLMDAKRLPRFLARMTDGFTSKRRRNKYRRSGSANIGSFRPRS